MHFPDLIDRRRSVRAYTAAPIDDVMIEKILQASRMAPSAGDLQSYRIVVVHGPDTKAALADAAGQDFIEQAALVIIFFADPERAAARYHDRGRALFALQDATIAAAYIQLAAADLGLASCWVGAFSDEGVRLAVGAPAGLRPVAMVTIGHAAETPTRPPRRRLEDLVVRERFGH